MLFARTVEAFGRLLDWMVGTKRVIPHVQDHYAYDIHEISPTLTLGPGDQVRVISERILFQVRYSRLKFLNHHRMVFRVRGTAQGEIAKKLPQEFFTGMYFPVLSNWFLKWTKYPHLYAIHAFVDAIDLG